MRCFLLAGMAFTTAIADTLSADQLKGLDIDAAIAKVDDGSFENNFFPGYEDDEPHAKRWFGLASPEDTEMGQMSSCVMDKVLGVAEMFGEGADAADHTAVADLLIDVPACCKKGAHRAACVGELREGYNMIAKMHDKCAFGDGCEMGATALEAMKLFAVAADNMATLSGSKAGASAAAFLAHAKGCTDGTECKRVMDQLRNKHNEL
jgi:hypothetical protein